MKSILFFEEQPLFDSIRTYLDRHPDRVIKLYESNECVGFQTDKKFGRIWKVNYRHINRPSFGDIYHLFKTEEGINKVLRSLNHRHHWNDSSSCAECAVYDIMEK